MHNKIAILFTIPNFKTAGSQYVLLNILNNLNEDKFETFICVEKFPDLIPNEIKCQKKIHFKKTGIITQDIKNFAKIIRNNKIDIVHSWDHKSEYIEAVACRVQGVKYLFTKKNIAWSKRWKLKSILANHIAYDNPKMKYNFFSNWYFKNKTTFIPHGIDLKLFKPYSGSNHETFNICCIGNIVENKNQIFLIQLMQKLSNSIRLTLVGRSDPDYLMRIEALIEKNNLHDRVEIKNHIENKEVPEFLQEQDIFMLVSKREGLPVSILEAMACGVPVLSSDSGGGAEFILQNNKGGYVLDLENEKGFIAAIEELKNNRELLDQKSQQALENVRERFDVLKEVNLYEKLYSKLING